MTTVTPPAPHDAPCWRAGLLGGLGAAGVAHLPYLPDKPLGPLVDMAPAHGFVPVPLTREEEGVGIAIGLNLSGRRAALLMQASGMGNCLNAIGSVAMAQRVPLLLIVTERGGLGETVATQVPFGAALPTVVSSMGIHHVSLEDPDQVDQVTGLAADLAFTARQVVLLHVRSILTKRGA